MLSVTLIDNQKDTKKLHIFITKILETNPFKLTLTGQYSAAFPLIDQQCSLFKGDFI